MKLLAGMILAAALPYAARAEVAVTDPWARASILASRPAAAYLTLTSDRADRVIGVTTPVAGQVMMHGVETDGAGVSRMVPVDALELAPGVPVTFAPGDMHLMLMDLSRKLEEGEHFPLTLVLETAGELTVDVPVLGPGATGPAGE